jgi:hypothetical protein
MLVIDRTETGPFAGRVRVIDALPLAHRVKAEHDETELDQALTETLVGGVRFAERGVTHLHEHGRHGAARARWDVEITGDVEAGAGFKDNLVDLVAGTFEGTGGAGI